MNFYKIAWIEDPEMESGIYNQLQFELDYELEFSDNCYSNLKNYELPNFEPVFGKLILHPNAQLTDFLSISLGEIGGNGFIISEKAKQLFSNFNLPIHRYYPLSIYKQGGEKLGQNYFWLQIIDSINIIDYKQSRFFITVAKPPIIEKIFLSTQNHQELINECAKLRGLRAIGFEKLVLNDNYRENPLDIFFIPKGTIYGIISERLKNKLEEENITGLMPFEEYNLEL
jgi:hypothetical protein